MRPLGLAAAAGALLLCSTAVAAPSPTIPQIDRYRLQFAIDEQAEPRLGPDGQILGMGLVELERIRTQYNLRFERLFKLSDDRLDDLRRRAASLSGRPQPNLKTRFAVAASDLPADFLVRVAEDLRSLPEMLWVSIEPLGVPPPVDIAPPTPDFTSRQTYLQAPAGLDIPAARSRNLTGVGVRVSDCEYGWINDHEDIGTVFEEPNQTPNPQVASRGWDQHGGAVLGIMGSVPNAYGMSGTAPDAELRTYPEWTNEGGFRRPTSVASAIADSRPGDIVVLEMQTAPFGANRFVVAEYDPAVFEAVRMGTNAGVIVIAAAGNGNQDLDSSSYAAYRSRGDSGAIIVGAGTNDARHQKLGFSTYGSRVNVQGWGTGVATHGYGDLARVGGDRRQTYTRQFGGTSSATPIVTSAAILIQQFARQELGRPLTPTEMRELLVSTGRPQGGNTSQPIGPFPDLGAALTQLENRRIRLEPLVLSPVAEGSVARLQAVASVGFGGPLTYRWTIGGQTFNGAQVDYPTRDDATIPVELLVSSALGSTASAQGDLTVTNVPPTVLATGMVEGGVEGSPVRQSLTATDPGDDTITLELTQGPVTETGAQIATDRTFSFTPRYEDAQAGSASFVVTARDEDGGESTLSLTYTVTYLDDDADGAPDTWEIQNGYDPTNPQDGQSDEDGDGRTLVDEFREGSDPRQDDRPAAPELLTPAADVVTAETDLTARASSPNAAFRFGVSVDAGAAVESSSIAPPANGELRWRISPAPAENAIVEWDAVGFDRYASGPRSERRRFVFSTMNEAPAIPRVVSRQVDVGDNRVTVDLVVEAGADPEHQAVDVEARIVRGAVVLAESRASGPVNTPISIQVSADREDDLAWTVRSVDPEGEASAWLPEEAIDNLGDCSCTSSNSGSSASAWVLLLALGGLRLRRSRLKR